MLNRPLSQVAKVLGVIVAVSGVLGAGAAISNSVSGGGWRPAWFMFGFELIVLLSGVMCVRLGQGKYGSAGLGLVCAAGAVVVASLFGFLGSGRTVWGFGLMPLLVARTGMAVLIAALAGAVQLEGRAGGTRLVVRGAAMGAAALALLGGAWGLRSTAAGWPDVLVLSLLLIGFVVVVGLIAASADCLIRAFSPRKEDAAGA